jgi:fructokinase
MNASRGGTSYEILAVGEILWDLLPAGKQLGGAPANSAYHAHALGSRVHLISRVGDDPLGLEILGRLHGLGVPADFVATDPAAPTGTVTVELSADGQPRFTIHENVAWDRISVDEHLLELAGRVQAVCFGSLAQRRGPSRDSIRRLVSATPAGALRVFDINIRQHFYSAELIEASLRLANVLKLNDQELVLLASMFDLRGDTREQVASLGRLFGLDTVALTRGAGGSLLVSGGAWSEHPGLPARVADTVGAGDAFTAAMTLGLLAGWPLDRINRLANEIAAYVCSQPGATPKLPDELRGGFAL